MQTALRKGKAVFLDESMLTKQIIKTKMIIEIYQRIGRKNICH